MPPCNPIPLSLKGHVPSHTPLIINPLLSRDVSLGCLCSRQWLRAGPRARFRPNFVGYGSFYEIITKNLSGTDEITRCQESVIYQLTESILAVASSSASDCTPTAQLHQPINVLQVKRRNRRAYRKSYLDMAKHSLFKAAVASSPCGKFSHQICRICQRPSTMYEIMIKDLSGKREY